jgi:hypothetical protein
MGLKPGGGGSNIANPLDVMTFAWMALLDKRKFSCLVHLPWLSDLADFWERNIMLWLTAQSEVPSHNVLQTFQERGKPNPTKDPDHELSIFLSRQFRSYQNDNPK